MGSPRVRMRSNAPFGGRRLWRVLAPPLLAIGIGAATMAPAQAQVLLPIEERYEAAGPRPVSQVTVTDATGARCEVFHPSDLGDGERLPILTFANGTGGTVEGATPALRHYASWGYVVTASYSGFTGRGTEAWACAQKAISDDSNPSSPLSGHLDTGKIGAFGGSQGAVGAVNATILSGGVIKSTQVWALIDPWVVDLLGIPRPDWSKVDKPTLMMHGSLDFIATQPEQQNYYNQINGPAAKATRNGADHNGADPDGTGGVSDGYGIAWFKYTLDGDDQARSAFAGDSPEINDNPDWANQAEKNLP
jgi:hypothetical protein